jgi:hypothetical protein
MGMKKRALASSHKDRLGRAIPTAVLAPPTPRGLSDRSGAGLVTVASNSGRRVAHWHEEGEKGSGVLLVQGAGANGHRLQPVNYDRQDDEKRCRVTHEIGLKGRFVGVEVAKTNKGNGPPRNRHAIPNLAPATLNPKKQGRPIWLVSGGNVQASLPAAIALKGCERRWLQYQPSTRRCIRQCG